MQGQLRARPICLIAQDLFDDGRKVRPHLMLKPHSLVETAQTIGLDLRFSGYGTPLVVNAALAESLISSAPALSRQIRSPMPHF